MNGVTIHAEHIYRSMSVSAFVFVTVLFLAVSVYCIGMCAKGFRSTSNKRKKWIAGALMLLIIIAFLSLELLGIHDMKVIHKEYVVTIDDSVFFNEFFDHYEIISIDGNLYTVKEIEPENTEPEVSSYDG